MSDERQWDVALSRHGNGYIGLVFPKPISVALSEGGMNRAKLRITKDGLLLTPYVSNTRRVKSVDLPDWGTP